MNRFTKRPSRNQTPFPTVMGTEHELGITVRYPTGKIDEPYALAMQMYDLLPTGVTRVDQMLSNGGKLYIGGTAEQLKTNIEVATPECVDPLQLVRHTRGSQELIRLIAEAYVEQSVTDTEAVFINHRVVDRNGSRKGVHDNYSFNIGHSDGRLKNALCDLIAARSIVSGAGYVQGGGYRFSQKLGGLSKVNSYGYVGSVYRTTREHGDRIEIRCNDANISDWAAWQRIGIVAMFLACYSVPETRQKLLEEMVERTDFELLSNIKNHNVVPTRFSGAVFLDDRHTMASDVLRSLATTVLDTLPEYVGEVPQGYIDIAKELLRYCHDFDVVAEGGASVELLADRADWAAKLVMINKKLGQMREDVSTHKKAFYRTAVNMDIGYSYVLVEKDADGKVVHQEGKGIRARSRGRFASPVISDDAVRSATYSAPKETRAWSRAQAIKSGELIGADWHVVRRTDARGGPEELSDLSLLPKTPTDN